MPVRTGLWRCSVVGSLLLATVVALACSSGCGKKIDLVNVSGSVKVKGQPLTHGVVMIKPADGNITSALIQPDGTFTVTDVMPGEVNISINEFVMDRDPSQGAGSKRVAIPEKYKEMETSGLKFTVGPDSQAIDLNLD